MPSDAASELITAFDEAAPTYDDVGVEFFTPVGAELVRLAGVTPGDHVLDVGCGRGAVLLAAAQRLPRGRAIGVDMWRSVDQSGNDETTTRANAAAYGVSDRVELLTADMSSLPLPDSSVDVVVSSLAIHNVPEQAARDEAVREAARVLRPGGRLAVVDIREVPRYADQLTAVGMTDVQVRDLGWRFWYGPGLGAKLVSARRP